MIVTLAGHVDHGKTSLVRALTGVDTDRLSQEKERGLTIDLGFAYMDDGRIGFVDVPGHHRFIHNMVAGVAQNQHAMLVVAADDGPMPQTREHLQILSLAGVRSGLIALTKTDRVEPEQLQQTQQRIKALVADTFLKDASIIPTSIEHADSIDKLRDALRSAAQQFSIDADHHPFRLAIDRAFNLRGVGLIVTGTVHSGHIGIDDTLFHSSTGASVRVRSIRTQDQPASQAGMGDRCAINLTGLDLELVQRGDWLSSEPPTDYTQLTLKLQVLEDFPRRIKHWTPVHLYFATSHATGRIALLDTTAPQPGTSAMVDVICDSPLPARRGDQLIIRDHSLDLTLGGGAVIHGQTHSSPRRRSPARQQMLTSYAQPTALAALQQLLAHQLVPREEFRQLWHLTELQMQSLAEQCDALQVKQQLVGRPYLQQQSQHALQTLSSHLQQHPQSPGLRENEFGGLHASLRQGVLNGLVAANQMGNAGGYYTLPQHQAALPDELAQIWRRLQPELDRKQTPSTGDIAKQWRQPQAGIDSALKELSRRGHVVQVAPHRFYLPEQLQALAAQVAQMCAIQPLSVKDFRDATGIGRNVAIEILEYFDSRGFTRRQGNERIVLQERLTLR